MKRVITLIALLVAPLVMSACSPTCYDRVLRDGTVIHECR